MFFFNNLVKAEYEKIFYDLKIESITGEIIDFKEYENKAVLLVNTASYCGFTNQYDELQELWDTYKSKGLIVLGIPCLLYTSPSPRDLSTSRMPSSA